MLPKELCCPQINDGTCCPQTYIYGGHVADSNCQGWAAEVEERQTEAEVLHHHCQTQHFTDQKLSSTIFPYCCLVSRGASVTSPQDVLEH